jgi:hypothetical protein
MQVGEKHTEEREAENQYHDSESGGYICSPTLKRMQGCEYAMDGTIRERWRRGLDRKHYSGGWGKEGRMGQVGSID